MSVPSCVGERQTDGLYHIRGSFVYPLLDFSSLELLPILLPRGFAGRRAARVSKRYLFSSLSLSLSVHPLHHVAAQSFTTPALNGIYCYTVTRAFSRKRTPDVQQEQAVTLPYEEARVEAFFRIRHREGDKRCLWVESGGKLLALFLAE